MRPFIKGSGKNHQSIQNIALLPLRKVLGVGQLENCVQRDTGGGLERETEPVQQCSCTYPLRYCTFRLKQQKNFWKWRCVKHVLFCKAFQFSPQPPRKEDPRIKHKRLCSIFESTQETRHQGDEGNSRSWEIETRCKQEDLLPTHESLERLRRIISFAMWKRSPSVNYMWNLGDRTTFTNYRTWRHLGLPWWLRQ